MNMEIEFDDFSCDGDTRNRRFKCTEFKKRTNEKERIDREQKKLQREEQRKAASVTVVVEATPEPAKPAKNAISARMTKTEKNKIYEEDMQVNKPKDKQHKMKCFMSSHKI